MSDAFDVQHMPAGQGWDWIRRGFDLFKQAPGIWIALVVSWFLIETVANVVPLGGLAMGLLGPVFTGGILFGCRDLEAGQPLRVGHLFEGFRSPRAGPLVLLGLCVMILFVLVGLIVAAVVFATAGSMDAMQMQAGHMEAGAATAALLVAMVLFVPVLMAIWFATQLVALHDMDPVAALKASFSGCAHNIGALTVYGLLLIPLGLLALVPLGLGLLILAPTMMAASYCSYIDIFGEAAPEEASTPPAPSLVD